MQNIQNNNNEVVDTIFCLEKQKESLKSQMNLGIIDSSGVRCELELINKKQKVLREQLVLANHLTKDGEPRAITHHEPTADNPKDYYITRVNDGKKLKANTYEALMEKLYLYYADGLRDFSVASIFEAAIAEKAATENPQLRTLERNRNDYNKFISDDLRKTDIRTITDIDLKRYIQDYVSTKHPKEKAFLSFKGTLNLIFGYAYIHKIISDNPVTYIKNRPYLKSCDTSKAKSEEKIFSPEEIEMLKNEVRFRMNSGLKRYGNYYITGYAMLFAIETGVRVGELCALKWEDVHENYIHIHAQQLYQNVDGKKEIYYAPFTKNEKGVSADGRQFPLTDAIADLLAELKALQESLGINSEFIFCNEDGRWMIEEAYTSFLRRLCRSKGLTVTNNHAFRMSLNSNVFIPMGISVADRAALLGHSIETNMRYYSYSQKDLIDNVKAKLNGTVNTVVGTQREPNKIIPFAKKEIPQTLKIQSL